MSSSEHCKNCDNDHNLLTAKTADAYFFCLAGIGEAWFKDLGPSCLACALLAETGHYRPINYLELRRKFPLLAATTATGNSSETSSPALNEGCNGFIWSK
ncbi:hypothetical protein HYU89_00330 [Candidatus Collierbacteria bacterium]|nr:hypothetical protein [Candidatus Collierbacteria bacterium]